MGGNQGGHHGDAGHSDEAEDHGHGPQAFHHDEGGHGEGEPWLVSYADLMTLLFGFFVLMYSIANAKAQREQPKASVAMQELAKYFGGRYVNPMEVVEKKLMTYLVTNGKLGDVVKVRIAPEGGVSLIIGSQLLFESGSAELLPGAIPILKALITTVMSVGKSYQVKVTGHTDDAPIHTAQYPSNWELSAARAARVVRMFEDAGFEPDQLIASGLGSSHPEYANHDQNGVPIPENRAQNRRVVIYVTPAQGDDADKKPKPSIEAPKSPSEVTATEEFGPPSPPASEHL